MPRYRLTLEYNGTAFQGWQRQANGPSVQQAVEEAVLAFSGQPALVVGSGRTDAGVHALAQVAHLDLAREIAPERLRGALNAHLRARPVVVLEAARVDDDFHARFSAVQRRYRYWILDRRAPPALLIGRVWHVPVPLDAEGMHEAAQALVGRHDFTSFRAAECQAQHAVRTLDRLHVQRLGELVEIRAIARSFLHHQVRNIAGTLKLVGEGRQAIGWVAAVLAARNRTVAGPTAPPHGLYLEAVRYPGER